MASSQLLTILAILSVLVPSISATEFVVGDDKGWTVNFDYQAWAERKEFHVGDKLVFKYQKGAHDVLRVNGTDFQQCLALASTLALMTGNDVITLSSPGRKWSICGIGKHCDTGNMKLAITVLPHSASPNPNPSSAAPSPSLSPEPVSAATAIFTVHHGWKVATTGTFIMMIML